MATWDDVSRIAGALPETVESAGSDDLLSWKVRNKAIAWDRPLRKSDLAALAAVGEAAPDGPILGVWVPDLNMKEALLAEDPAVYFTTPHFNGYPAVLVRLGEIDVGQLRDLLEESWLGRAPKRLAAKYLADRA
jgi:hypothetical protein